MARHRMPTVPLDQFGITLQPGRER